MKIALVQELSFLRLIYFLFLKIKYDKIFYVQISKNLRKKKILLLLKKLNIYWINHQEFKIDEAVIFQMLDSYEIMNNISNEFIKLFKNDIINEIYLNETFFKACLEYNLFNNTLNAIELLNIHNFLKKENNDVKIFVDENEVYKRVLKKCEVKFIKKYFFNITILLYPIKLLLKIFKAKSYFLKKRKEITKDSIDSKVIFFPHNIVTGKNLYTKDFFYSEKKYSDLKKENILHIEWSKNHLNKTSKKYYEDNNLKVIFWNELSSNLLIFKKISIKYILKKFVFFYKIFRYDKLIFSKTLLSIFQLERALFILKKYKNVKIVLAGHDFLFLPEISIACKKLKIKTVALEDRIVLSSWVKRIIFDYYFTAGPKSEKNFIKRFEKSLIENLEKGTLFKVKNHNSENFIKN